MNFKFQGMLSNNYQMNTHISTASFKAELPDLWQNDDFLEQ